jgi:hypothetical protein
MRENERAGTSLPDKTQPYKGQSQLVDLQGCSATSTQDCRQKEPGRHRGRAIHSAHPTSDWECPGSGRAVTLDKLGSLCHSDHKVRRGNRGYTLPPTYPTFDPN